LSKNTVKKLGGASLISGDIEVGYTGGTGMMSGD
jgi:hypothetical protein